MLSFPSDPPVVFQTLMQNHAYMGNNVINNHVVGQNVVVGYGNHVNYAQAQNVVMGYNQMYKQSKPQHREPGVLIPLIFADVISSRGFGPARNYDYLNIPKFTFRTYGDFGIAHISLTDESIMINFLALNESVESYFRHFIEQNKGFTCCNTMFGNCAYKDIRQALDCDLPEESLDDESSAKFFREIYGNNYYYIKITSDNCDFGIKAGSTIYFELDPDDLMMFREIVLDIFNSANREFELVPPFRAVQIGTEKFIGIDNLSPLIITGPDNNYTAEHK